MLIVNTKLVAERDCPRSMLDLAALPPRIETPAKLKVMQVDWANAASSWDEARRFATKLFAAGLET